MNGIQKAPGPLLRTEWGEFRVTDVIEDEWGHPVPVVSGTPAKPGLRDIEAYLDIPEDTTSIYIGYARDPRNWCVREMGRTASVCEQCGTHYRLGTGAGIRYSHTVGLDGKPLSDEPLPPNRHFCSKLCLDRWDAEHSDGFPTQPPGPLPPGLTLHHQEQP